MHWPNHKPVTEQKKPRASKKVSKGDERQSEARNHPSGQRMRATFKMSQTHKAQTAAVGLLFWPRDLLLLAARYKNGKTTRQPNKITHPCRLTAKKYSFTDKSLRLPSPR
jgi:hypothetical protein